MQYVYSFKTRYGVVHAELGPVFMVSPSHLEMLWSALTGICRAQDCRRAIVERSARFRDLRVTEVAGTRDLLCGLEAPELRVVFCLYGLHADEFVAPFALLAASEGCVLHHFSEIDAAFAWVGDAFAEDLAVARLRAESRQAAAAEHAQPGEAPAGSPARVA